MSCSASRRRASRRRIRASLTALVMVLCGCTGDADLPNLSSIGPVTAVSAPVVTGVVEGTALSAVETFASAARTMPDGWVEDSAWAEAGRFAGSAWRPLASPKALAPAERDGPRIGASPGDDRGALWQRSAYDSETGGVEGEIFDMCILEEAVALETLNGAHPLTPLDARQIQEYMDELDCDGDGVKGPLVYGHERGRYVYAGRGYVGDLAADGFATRAEALAFSERYERQMIHRWSHTIPYGAWPLGLDLCATERCHGKGRWRAIEYSDADMPVNEVRVLAGSLSMVDGALRGLVRNWSPDQWAYRVAVTAGDRQWHWPLALQPGEAAPFEFENWHGDQDPLAVEYTVAAQHSSDIDRTRHWRIRYWITLLPDEFDGYLPQVVLDSLNPGDNEALAYYEVRPAYPAYVDSHPSLNRYGSDRLEGAWQFDLPPLEFKPLAYGARFDADGRVIEVAQLTPTVPHMLDAEDPADLVPVVVKRVEPDPYGGLGFYIAARGSYNIWVGGTDTAPPLQ